MNQYINLQITLITYLKVRPSGEEATAAAIRAIVSMVSIFWVFFVNTLFVILFMILYLHGQYFWGIFL